MCAVVAMFLIIAPIYGLLLRSYFEGKPQDYDPFPENES